MACFRAYFLKLFFYNKFPHQYTRESNLHACTVCAWPTQYRFCTLYVPNQLHILWCGVLTQYTRWKERRRSLYHTMLSLPDILLLSLKEITYIGFIGRLHAKNQAPKSREKKDIFLPGNYDRPTDIRTHREVTLTIMHKHKVRDYSLLVNNKKRRKCYVMIYDT